MSPLGARREPEFVWATRGKTWGFRFLRDGGQDDPLFVYDAVFSELESRSETWGRVGDRVGLRFSDPEGRTDASGRVIPHEFVVLGPDAGRISSLEGGVQLVWTEVAGEFARVWDLPEPPPARSA